MSDNVMIVVVKARIRIPDWVWKGVIVAIVSIGSFSSASGQSVARSLRVWVDTINLNVCEGRDFDSLGVWLESYIRDEEEAAADRVIGFRVQDSVLGCQITLRWDTSRIRLQPPYILTPPQTVFGRFPSKTQYVDTIAGVLTVEATANENLKIGVGVNIPLFYLQGKVRASDTVELPDGGARTQFIYIEGKLGDDVGTVEFLPGFVRVIRDTTPEYTGTLQVMQGRLDTNRRDTVFIIANNLADKRVNEFRFALRADTSAFKFIDTVEFGTLSSRMWNSKQVDVSADSIYARFIADADLTGHDSVIIGVIIERTTDSAFSAMLGVSEFGINGASCLGKLITLQGEVSGEAIPVHDTTMTSVQEDEGLKDGVKVVVEIEPGNIRLTLHGIDTREVLLYDMTGRIVERQSSKQSETEMEIHLSEQIANGMYFLAVRDRNGRIWYKQVIIQTN